MRSIWWKVEEETKFFVFSSTQSLECSRSGDTYCLLNTRRGRKVLLWSARSAQSAPLVDRNCKATEGKRHTSFEHPRVALFVKLSSCFHGDMLKFHLCRSIESYYEKDSFRFLVTEERCWDRWAGDVSNVSKLLLLNKALNFDLKIIVRMTTKKHFEAETKCSNKAVHAQHDSTSHIKSHWRHQVTPSCQQTLTEDAFSRNILIKNSRVSVFKSSSSRTTRGATRSGSAWHKCNVESLLITFLLVDEKWMLND